MNNYNKQVSTSGQMAESLMGNGKIIKWKAQEYSHGLMEEDMMENIQMIRKKEMEHFIGRYIY